MSLELQNPKIRNIYDVISTYVCNLLFTQLYKAAKINNDENSLYDSYVSCVQRYTSIIRTNPQKFNEFTQQAYNYFVTITSFTIGYTGFVDTIVGISTPANYFPKLTREQRDVYFDSIMCYLLTNLTAHALSAEINPLIVDANNRVKHAERTTNELRLTGVEFLFAKRSLIINELYQKIEQANTKQDMSAFVNLKIEFRELLKKKVKAEKLVYAQSDRIQELENDRKKIKDHYKEKIVSLEQDVEQLKAKLREINSGKKPALSSYGVNSPPVRNNTRKNSSESEESGDEESGDEESGDEESGDEESGDEESGVEYDESEEDGESVDIDIVDDIIEPTPPQMNVIPHYVSHMQRPPSIRDADYVPPENPYDMC